jgi:hypothetical protein
VVSISPGIAYHLFQANSDDPATIGTTLVVRALNLAGIYLHQQGKAPGTLGTGPPTLTPTSDAFFEACALLWVASQPSNYTHTVPVEILAVGPPASWATTIRDSHILPATPGPGPGLARRGVLSKFLPGSQERWQKRAPSHRYVR